jgi:hypothetical protein
MALEFTEGTLNRGELVVKVWRGAISHIVLILEEATNFYVKLHS